MEVDEGGGKAGWLLLRQSLHDPLLVVNIESEVPGGLAASREKLRDWIRCHPAAGDLDFTSLHQ